MSKVSILVITHKSYEFPHSNIYRPLWVGKKSGQFSQAFLSDDTGKHISGKNSSFCELTGLYWAWKNHFFKDVEYMGLVHYRRYFTGVGEKLRGKAILSEENIVALLKEYDCILPKKRNYFIESIYSHYKHAHHIRDLNITKEIISKDYPAYIESFEKIMSGKSLHLYNMFIMKKIDFDKYCTWLFDILFKLEEKIDITNYDDYQKRVFGFIAERLFNVWVYHHKLRIKEISVVNLEGENLFSKATQLIIRKFVNR
ncbi:MULTISPECIES: DUF4422 domain-containing protein [unclassified Pasteurella]|uniref:DUF4422 domain-containing protein n=1 Tax=unclassified Pasteurella TaxID=2621516 RepID=UPI001073A1E4|nr:DUF4422 domain-containing protein [Pasteurella sp. 19428wF3_WM03]TFU50628.1 DUF4422 domain-containing protein [Pasteurella sp. WM03]